MRRKPKARGQTTGKPSESSDADRRRPTAEAPSAGRRDTEPTELRIIGGNLRGSKLLYSGDSITRPMKDRVREAVFNLVGPAVVGKHVLDLFAGTGALGLEALSRGARTATFLERHFPTADLIVRNAATLALSDRAQVVPTSAFVWVRREFGGAGGPRTEMAWRDSTVGDPWVVFISPPYDFYLDRESEMLSLVAAIIANCPEDSVVVVEADTRFEMPRLPEPQAWDVRTYSPAVIAVYRKSAGEG